jgi:hypothetical protein
MAPIVGKTIYTRHDDLDLLASVNLRQARDSLRAQNMRIGVDVPRAHSCRSFNRQQRAVDQI